MQLSQLIAPADVLLEVRVSDKPELLRQLAGRLAARAGVPPAVIEDLLSSREELGSTGIGRGVALPHARAVGAKVPCAVFARLSKPIDFEAVDGRPVDLVCAVIAPDQPRVEALTALAAVSRILRDGATVAALRKAKDPQSLYDGLMAASATASES